jgi:hypothetical protein
VAQEEEAMAGIMAIDVRTYEGNSVTQDGSHGLFKFMTSEGEITLAIPHEQLMPTMAGLSHASGQSAQIRNVSKTEKHAFPCEWWEIGFSDDNQHFFLSFRMPGGMEMSFQVHRSRLSQMRETLESMEGKQTIPSDGMTKQ